MDKALIVAINAYDSAPLRGCLQDQQEYAKFLTSKCNFPMGAIHLLSDKQATTKNILDRLDWLVSNNQPGDRLFFAFSGHGVQVATRNPELELDGLNEALVPYEFDWTEQHMIQDKQLKGIFSKLPQGCKLIFCSDSCHSGDLDRSLNPTYRAPRTYPLTPDMEWRIQTIVNEMPQIKDHTIERTLDNSSNVVLLAGCKSTQTSADAQIGNKYHGVFTYYLLDTLNNKDINTVSLSVVIGETIKKLHKAGYEQTPQVCGNRSYSLTRGIFSVAM